MLWNKKKQCLVCGLYSRIGERIHGRFMCRPCELQMIEDQCNEHEEREWAELNRLSNQTQRWDENGKQHRVG